MIYLFFILFLFLSYQDLKTKEVSTLPLIILFLISIFFNYKGGFEFKDICTESFIIGLSIVGFCYTMKIIFKFFTDKTLLGEADFFIIASIGSILGINIYFIVAMLISFISGFFVNLFYKYKYKEDTAPLIPSLFLGFSIVYFF